MSHSQAWKRYQRHLCVAPSINLRLDISRMTFSDSFIEDMAGPINKALTAMDELERGAIANQDENRMVGHYWLRDASRSPSDDIRNSITETIAEVKRFADDVQAGVVSPQHGDGFFVVLVVGIGGSALGPQFVADALGGAEDPVLVRFIDNTDPDGIDRTLAELDDTLGQTLTVVISKSGGTAETRNGMLEVQAAYQSKGLDFAKHAVAITGEGSKLDRLAHEEGWLRTFPMWDFVGGRTSEFSAVGLLPAALQGIDIDAVLDGARSCDEVTRGKDIAANPAALMALMWHHATGGKAQRAMVVLPYRDRLALFGKYLQQLVMESLGKEFDRTGAVVNQGLTVYGNKGSTDQHAYIQQLREGPDDFFATFVHVLQARRNPGIMVGENATAGDYLHGFMHGTRTALADKGHQSMTITIDKLDARAIGVLIALFERAVGLYAELVNINAYHQPGVEAGKKAADELLALQGKVLTALRAQSDKSLTIDEVAQAVGGEDTVERVFHLLEHLAANPDHKIGKEPGQTPFDARYAAM